MMCNWGIKATRVFIWYKGSKWRTMWVICAYTFTAFELKNSLEYSLKSTAALVKGSSRFQAITLTEPNSGASGRLTICAGSIKACIMDRPTRNISGITLLPKARRIPAL